jgi:hypothetical protein
MSTRGALARAGALVVVLSLLLVAIKVWSPATENGAESHAIPVHRLPERLRLASLQTFGSCDSMLAWVKTEAGKRVTAWGLDGGVRYYAYGAEDAVGGTVKSTGAAREYAGTPSAAPANSATTTAGAPAFSGTNTQVAGIDEPDTVKTDGTRIVALVDQRLRLVDATVTPPKVLDTVALEQSAGDAQLLLVGDRVFVFTSGPMVAVPAVPAARSGVSASMPAPDVVDPGPYTPVTKISEYDIADGRLRLANRLDVDGSIVTSRVVDGVARVVVRTDPQARLGFVAPSGGANAGEQRALRTNREVIAGSTVDDWLPHYTLRNDRGHTLRNGTLVPCESVDHPATFSGFGALDIVTLDLTRSLPDALTPSANAAVFAGGDTVYASADHLYVATAKYVDAPAPGSTPRFGPNGSDSVVAGPMIPARDAEQTAIHRFDISSPERTQYDGSGIVDGHLLDNYSMDEHDDLLRVATTVGQSWEGTASESHVVVLAMRDGSLQKIGDVGGLGRGEQIHAVRFIGTTAYVVTFRQTDPLYVVDLRDPQHPAVASELQMLGYSAYLHPVADGWLLGVGRDADASGRTTGMQVALYDVRDPAHPRRVAQQVVTGAQTDVEWDRHAFLWWAPADLAVVPSTSYNGDVSERGYGVDVEHGTIAERGQVDVGQNWGPTARVLVIGDTLYVVSHRGIDTTDVQSFTPATTVPW